MAELKTALEEFYNCTGMASLVCDCFDNLICAYPENENPLSANGQTLFTGLHQSYEVPGIGKSSFLVCPLPGYSSGRLYCTVCYLDPYHPELGSGCFGPFVRDKKAAEAEKARYIPVESTCIFVELFRKILGHDTGCLSPVLGSTNYHIRRVVDYIRADYQHSITLAGAAAELSLNKSYLCRLLRRELGITLTELIARVRIEKSKQLIKAGVFSMTEISAATGYKSQSHFTRQFKKVEGITPLQFKFSNAPE